MPSEFTWTVLFGMLNDLVQSVAILMGFLWVSFKFFVNDEMKNLSYLYRELNVLHGQHLKVSVDAYAKGGGKREQTRNLIEFYSSDDRITRGIRNVERAIANCGLAVKPLTSRILRSIRRLITLRSTLGSRQQTYGKKLTTLNKYSSFFVNELQAIENEVGALIDRG